MYLAHFGQRARPENARRLLVRIVPVCQTRTAVGRIFADTYSAYTLSRVDVHATSRRAWEGRVLRAGAGALGWCMLGARGLVLLARPVIAGVLTARAISRRDGSVGALKVFALAGLFGMAVPALSRRSPARADRARDLAMIGTRTFQDGATTPVRRPPLVSQPDLLCRSVKADSMESGR